MGVERCQRLLHGIHAELELVGYRCIGFVVEEEVFVAVVTECLLSHRNTERITKKIGGGSIESAAVVASDVPSWFRSRLELWAFS